MLYQGKFKSRNGDHDLEMSWNSDTGEFSGRDAARAEQFVSHMADAGYINILPCLNYPLSGEKLTPAEVGSILNQLWIIDDVFPQLDIDTSYPDGAVS